MRCEEPPHATLIIIKPSVLLTNILQKPLSRLATEEVRTAVGDRLPRSYLVKVAFWHLKINMEVSIMADEQPIIEQNENPNPNEDYIKAIDELKKRSVPKDEFNKLKEDNKRLLDALVNNKQIEIEQSKPNESKKELIEKLKSGTLSNLEYCDTALKLRQACIDAGERDPFLPNSHNYSDNRDDYEAAERVAAAFQHCVEYADGDSEVFTNELQRLTRDIRLPGRR